MRVIKVILPAYQTSGVPTNKKPLIREGRKVIPWFHPDSYHSHQGKRSGPEGARTPDLIHAMDALSQLRYRPIYGVCPVCAWYALIVAITGFPTGAIPCCAAMYRLHPHRIRSYCSQASSVFAYSLAPTDYSLTLRDLLLLLVALSFVATTITQIVETCKPSVFVIPISP